MGSHTSLSNTPYSSQCVAKYLTARVNDPPYNLADYCGIPRNKSITWLDPNLDGNALLWGKKSNKLPYLLL